MVGDRSGIEWTDATWNPTTGCTKVSPGCDNCYAARITNRFHGPGAFDTVEIQARRLTMPLHWRRPRRVFVDSMSDLFHADVPEDFICSVFNVMRCCDGSIVAATGRNSPSHTFQVLTKRAERLERLAGSRRLGYDPLRPPSNIWLGVSVESAAYYSRIHHLQRTPAALRFLSCEPLLGPLPHLPLEGIGWVIVGGESGPGARPMHPEWARSIRDQCGAAGVPFFFKQWGEWTPMAPLPARPNERVLADDGTLYLPADIAYPDGRRYGEAIRAGHDHARLAMVYRVGKHAAGRVLDGRTWDEMPAVSGPAAAI